MRDKLNVGEIQSSRSNASVQIRSFFVLFNVEAPTVIGSLLFMFSITYGVGEECQES